MEDYKKKYEQALENIKKIKAANKDNNELIDFIEYKYPELKESEDEKLREQVVYAINQLHVCECTKNKLIAWVEKQGEQKSEEEVVDNLHNYLYGEQKVEPKFKVGDCIRHKGTDECYRIVTIDDNYYFCENNHAWAIGSQDYFELVEQTSTNKVESKFKVGDWVVNNNGEPRVFRVEKQDWPDCIISSSLGNQFINTFTLDKHYHLWTIKDAKDGDVLCKKDKNCPFIYDKNRYNNGLAYYYAGIDKNGDLTVKSPQQMLCHFGRLEDVCPATTEQRDLLFQKMKEAGYEWDGTKKELRKIEQKHEINDNVLSRFAFYQYDNDTIYLSSVFVEECNRKRGYGSKILKAAEEVAKTLGISKIRLKVERNTWMEEWYKKNGYKYLSPDGEYNWLEKRVEQKSVDKVEPKFKVKYAGNWYNVFEVKELSGITFYGIEDEPNHIDYVNAGNCEIISGYTIKENGLPYPTKHAVFSEQKPSWSEEDEKMYQSIMDDTVQENQLNGKQTDWLRDIKYRHFSQPQNTWKPSDEQMEALLKLEEMHVLEHEKNQENAHLYIVIKSLKEQLFKLKGE